MDFTNIFTPQTRNERLAEFIRRWYDSKAEFARLSKMSPQQLHDYLVNPKRSPGADILERWLELGLNINWYLSGKGSMSVGSGDFGLAGRGVPELAREISDALGDSTRLMLERFFDQLAGAQEVAVQGLLTQLFHEHVAAQGGHPPTK